MFIKAKKYFSYNGKLKERARKMRKDLTPAESKLWYQFFRSYKYKFVRQKVIGNYIIDFYCQKLKLGIEIDGESHLGSINEKYDNNRSKELEKYGIKILRFWNEDVLKGLGEVEKIIEVEIMKRNPPNPLFERGYTKYYGS